jgi:cytosine/adenosine deaminase-related metal-dependent hydrolase
MMRWRIEAANGAVEVADGRIVAPTERFDHRIVVPDGILHPGLINAHDHLRLNHFGRFGNRHYANAYEWAADVQVRYREAIAAGRAVPRRLALLWGAWKNLLAGVTSVVHHDIWEPDLEQDFPLRVVRTAFADSLGMTPNISRPLAGPFALHLAEGIDANAGEEVRQAAERGFLDARLLAVHMVGADKDGIARMRTSGGAVIWCPTSNHFLFGCTAPDALLAEGMDVLLGTDSLLTGHGDLLDELRVARGGALSDERLEKAVGDVAAARLGLDPPSLLPGGRADLIVLRRPLLAAGAADTALVMAQGELRVLDPALLPCSGVRGGQFLQRDGFVRWISESATLPVPGLVAGCHRA